MNILEDKQLLRKEMRTILQEIPPLVREKNSQNIIQNITALSVYSRCALLFGFIPMQTEPDLSSLYDLALSQGKKVAFPRCLPKGEMTFHLVQQDWRNYLEKSPYGNLEPEVDRYPQISAQTLESSIILVPGLAFSPQRQRLGRSMGFFDRFLTHLGPHFSSIGVCFTLQMRSIIPTEIHDRILDRIVTESEVY